MQDASYYASAAGNYPTYRKLVDLFREAQKAAIEEGRRRGQAEFIKIAVDTDNRLKQVLKPQGLVTPH